MNQTSNVFTVILNRLSLSLCREGLVEDITLILPTNIFDRMCMELIHHQGKYLRHHPDGSVEEGRTIKMTFHTHHGKIFILRA